MAIRPLNDNVIILPDPDEYTDSNPEVVRILKEGLIKLPEKYEPALKKVSPTGRIVSWGSRCHYRYEVGQRVHFAQFAGTNLYADENGTTQHYRVLRELDLIATYEDKNG